MYRIIVTNDEGIYESGLRAVAQSAKGLGEVFVAAPSGQKSGVGRSISGFKPLRFAQVNMDGQVAHAVTGIPTDSVIIGIFAIMTGKMLDLVVSEVSQITYGI
jgi:5'-nucleotidase